MPSAARASHVASGLCDLADRDARVEERLADSATGAAPERTDRALGTTARR